MNRVTEQTIKLVVLESMRRYNQLFITKAMRRWDIDGQGRFQDYIRLQVNHFWVAMVRSN